MVFTSVVLLFFFFAIPLLGLRVSPFTLFGFPHCTLRDSSSLKCRVCSQLHSAFVGFMCLPYLYVSGPLDFRLVIQVLLSPRMFLNACVRRLHPCLTSLAEDVALPHDRVVHPYPSCTMPRPGIEPGLVEGDPQS